jgi:hypothetical protein
MVMACGTLCCVKTHKRKETTMRTAQEYQEDMARWNVGNCGAYFDFMYTELYDLGDKIVEVTYQSDENCTTMVIGEKVVETR